MDFLYTAFGQFLYFIYKTMAFQNYGVAIIIFTVIIKLVLLPLTIKSLKSTNKMSSLAPEVEKIKQKYKNDQEKQNQEIQKLYKENNVSCAGGCLPMLLQFPILIGLYTVLRSPLSYMLGKSWVQIANIANKLLVDLGIDKALDIPTITAGTLNSVKVVNQLNIMNLLNHSPEKLASVSEYISSSELINLNFLGLNLGITPSYIPSVIFGPEMSTYLPVLILPIIAVGLTVYSTILTKRKTAQTQPVKKDPNKKDPTAGMNSMMLYMLPLMTLYFSFIMPASMSLYWIITYAFQIGQQLLTNKMQDKEKADKDKKLEIETTKEGDKK
ncbi:MAG: YidC/Oxa1 family membrane protein insertase [Clostridia bacterium]|nr:YidC/Oxa1 family membrane protein insertase [Clostridia bacterium]